MSPFDAWRRRRPLRLERGDVRRRVLPQRFIPKAKGVVISRAAAAGRRRRPLWTRASRARGDGDRRDPARTSRTLKRPSERVEGARGGS